MDVNADVLQKNDKILKNGESLELNNLQKIELNMADSKNRNKEIPQVYKKQIKPLKKVNISILKKQSVSRKFVRKVSVISTATKIKLSVKMPIKRELRSLPDEPTSVKPGGFDLTKSNKQILEDSKFQRDVKVKVDEIDFKSNTDETFHTNFEDGMLQYFSKLEPLLNSGNFSEIVKLSDSFIRNYPNSITFHYNRGLAHLNLGNINLAKEDVLVCVSLNPNLVHVKQLAANIQEKLGFKEKAFDEQLEAWRDDLCAANTILFLQNRIEDLEKEEKTEVMKVNDMQNQIVIEIIKIDNSYDDKEKERLVTRTLNMMIRPLPLHFWPIVDPYSTSNFLLMMCRGATINIWNSPDEPIHIISALGHFIVKHREKPEEILSLLENSGDYPTVWYNTILAHITLNGKYRKRKLSRCLRNALDLDNKLSDFDMNKNTNQINSKKLTTNSEQSSQEHPKTNRLKNVIKNKALAVQRINVGLMGLVNGFSNVLQIKNPFDKQRLFEKFCIKSNFDKTKKIRVAAELIYNEESLIDTIKSNDKKGTESSEDYEDLIDNQWSSIVQFIKNHWNYVFFLNEDKMDATSQERKEISHVYKRAEEEYQKLINEQISQ